MADSGIPALPSATTLAGSEELHVVQGGNSRKTTTGSFYIPGGTDIAITDGGTGASDASGARTNLGLAIGSDVQAYNAGLADIAGLAKTDGNIIVGNGTNWVAESGATARASLGLTIGTDVQAYNSNLADISALTTTAYGRSFLTYADEAAFKAGVNLEIGVDVQAYDASLADIAGLTLTAGDVFYYNGTNIVNLGIGAEGEVLKSTSGLPAWGAAAGGGDMLASIYDPTAKAADAFNADNHVSGTTNKVFTATEQTKLAGIESGADVTDATNVAAAGAVMETDASTASMQFVIDEDDMASDSATKVPTQQSVNVAKLQKVATRTAMKALDGSKHIAVYLYEAGREGLFKWDASDLSSTILGAAIASTAVDSATDTITKARHGLFTGDAVLVSLATADLAEQTAYYVSVPNVTALNYDAETADFTVGQTLTGGTSGATATIDHIVTETTSTGTLYLTGVFGTFQDNEALTDGAGGAATCKGTTYTTSHRDEFRLSTSFANAHAGTVIDLTVATTITIKRHFDPLEGVYVTPSSDITGAGGAWVRQYQGSPHESWFGVQRDDTTDDTEAFFFACVFAASAPNPGLKAYRGFRLRCGDGHIRLTKTIRAETIEIRGVGHELRTDNVSPLPGRGTGTWFDFDHAGIGIRFAGRTAPVGAAQRSGGSVRQLATYRPTQTTPQSGMAFTPNLSLQWDFEIDNCEMVFEDVGLLNPTRGIRCVNAGRTFFKRITGQPLLYAFEVTRTFGVVRWGDIHFWPWWSTIDEVHAYTRDTGALFLLKRCDNPQFSNIFGIRYREGIQIGTDEDGTTQRIKGTNVEFDGSVFGLHILAGANDVIAQFSNFIAYANPNTSLGSRAVLIEGDDCVVQIANLEATNHRNEAVAITGTGCKVGINNFSATNWNASLAGAAAISVASGSRVDVTGSISAETSHGTPNFSAGAGTVSAFLGSGSLSGTTDASGDFVVTHGLPITPRRVTVTSQASGALRHFSVIAITATTFTVRVRDAAGAVVASTSVNAHWSAYL